MMGRGWPQATGGQYQTSNVYTGGQDWGIERPGEIVRWEPADTGVGKSANPAAGKKGEDGQVSSHAEPAWGNHEPEAG